jgi:HlyD family secretion protein
LRASEASSAAAKARADSAAKQAEAQKELTDSTIASASATLQAETERLEQIKKTTRLVQTASAQAALNQAAANLKNAEVQLKRQTALLEKGFIAESQVDQAKATFDVAQATYDSARVRLDTINPDVESDIRAQAARVDQVKASLRSAEANRVDVRLREENARAARADYQRSLADVDQARVAVRQAEANRFNTLIRRTQILQAQASGARANASMVNAQVQLDETRVTAPSDGIVLKKYIEPGTLISSGISFNSTGTNIVQFGDTTRMYVDVQVDETDVANVDLDQKVDITFDAYATQPFEGKVIKVDPQAVIEQNVTTVHVRVEVDNSSPSFALLKPGMNASCEFIVAEVDDVVMVPNEALKNDPDGTRYVELAVGGKPAPADKDGEKDASLFIEVKVTKQKFTSEEIGLEGNDSTELKGGLKGGETIITQTIEPSVTAPGGNPFGGSRGPGRR